MLTMIQVIVVALVLSFVIKRDSEVIDYEDSFGEMKTVDDVRLTDSNNYGTVTLPLVNYLDDLVVYSYFVIVQKHCFYTADSLLG